jgi:cysteine desulfurase / selenocysteine lyase
MFNPEVVKADFPILHQLVHGVPLVYLDNAATSQKPQAVIDAITEYYQTSNANVHRGVHALSDASTLAWQSARQTIAQFLGAQPEELIVVRNTTEAMNGVAYGWGLENIKAGDVILTTQLEHHSNFVVWQQLASRLGATFELVKLDEVGRIDLIDLKTKLQRHGSRVKVFTFVQVSNTTGTEQPLVEIVALCNSIYTRAERPMLIVDAAQMVPHQPLNFDQLDVDFLAFSGHKVLGPMGFGGLLVRREILEAGLLKPWLFGGGMISSVAVEQTQFHPDLAERFTAGTPDVASAVGMAAACDYLTKLGMKEVEQHDRQLVAYALARLAEVTEVKQIGPVEPQTADESLDRLGSVAFIYQGVHAHDVAQILDSQGIAVRSGHHCTMPYHVQQGWQATVRASFQVYTSQADIDALVAGLAKVKKIFLSK